MRLILCEGKHAQSALQGLLCSAFNCTQQPGSSTPEWFDKTKKQGQFLSKLTTSNDIQIFIQVTGGKNALWKALKLKLYDFPPDNLESLAICFDPDTQTEIDWRNTIENILKATVSYNKNNWDYNVSLNNKLTIKVLPIPWTAPNTKYFSSFPNNIQSLYRTTVTCLSTTFPEHTNKVETIISSNDLPIDNWKALAWLWMSIWHSDAECDHFFRKIMSDVNVNEKLKNDPLTLYFWDSLASLTS